jgi:FtsP/CotA-like multicopper oxidase with cupredoxin domain
MNRRDIIKKSLFAGSSLLLGKYIFPHEILNNVFAATPMRRTGNPLRFPPVLSGNNLILSKINYDIFPTGQTQVYAMNNSYLSPTIIAEKGSVVTVQFSNQLTNEDATIHWHGLSVPELMDGHPKDPITPGNSYTYSFPVLNRAGTYFYHAHAHELTAKQVYQGFAGLFLITDPDEAQLGLPSGTFDVPLVFQDHRNTNIPQFTYAPGMVEEMDGYLGDFVLVNGTYDPYLNISKTLYRFRLLNGSNARVYKIAFSNNQQFHIIGNDGGLIDAPTPMTSTYLAPGERIDILVDFSSLQISDSLYLKSLSYPLQGVGTYKQGIELNLLRLDVTNDSPSNGIIPTTLFPLQRYNANDVVNNRLFILSMSMGGGGMQHKINDKVFSMSRIDEEIPRNDLEMWNISNTTDEFHPMHIHGVQFQVYSRNGNTTLSPNESGWKDTVLVNPQENVGLLIKFSDYAGIFLLHCHNLEHEDTGMMLNIRINEPNAVQEHQNEEHNSVQVSEQHSHIIFHLPTQRTGNDFSIFNILGKKVFEQSVADNESVVQLETQLFPSGIYFGTVGNLKFRFSVVR